MTNAQTGDWENQLEGIMNMHSLLPGSKIAIKAFIKTKKKEWEDAERQKVVVEIALKQSIKAQKDMIECADKVLEERKRCADIVEGLKNENFTYSGYLIEVDKAINQIQKGDKA